MDAGKCLIPGVTMAEHAFSSFLIKQDNNSEVCSPVNSTRRNSEYYSCHTHFITSVGVEVLFEPNNQQANISQL